MSRTTSLLAATAGATLLVLTASYAAAPAGIAAAPMKSSAANPTYPRLTKFPDAKVMAKVNKALADMEKTDREGQRDCLAQLKEMKMKPDRESWHTATEVTYLSARYLTVDTLQSYYCGGPYPTSGARTATTFDLKTGEAVDFSALFKPGFMATADGKSVLTKLYFARYSKKPDDKECLGAVKQTDPSSSAILWLTSKGLMFQPDYPHVMAACATEMTLSIADIAPYLRDPALANDLKATNGK